MVTGAKEYELGLLSPNDAVSLLLEVAGQSVRKPPYSDLEYTAVELCGHLPLVLSIAGSMLEHHGGIVDDHFLATINSGNEANDVEREGAWRHDGLPN